MKSTYKWGAVAFGISLVSTLVYGQARTPYTRPAYITTSGNITTSANVSASTLNVGTTSTTTRSHMLCEETIYTPSDFNTKHAVFGRNATSGASSGGVWLSYHTGDNEGIIGALSPGTAWRPLAVAAQTLKMRPAGGAATVTLGNGVTSTGAIEGSTHNSTIASGSQAYTCTNVGCRLSLGNTARYFRDDGSQLEANSALNVTGSIKSGSTLTRGTISLASGTGTATVLSGAICACSRTDSATAVQCNVATTTLTATSGAGTGTVAYVCL